MKFTPIRKVFIVSQHLKPTEFTTSSKEDQEGKESDMTLLAPTLGEMGACIKLM